MARTHSRTRPLAALAALLLALALPTESTGKSFEILSQNLLRLGQGDTAHKTRKYKYFQNDVFENYEVVLMQEVMRQADMNRIDPGGYSWYMTGLKGRSTYKEAYGFLIKTPANGGFNVAGNGWVDYDDVNDWFERPPSGILVLSGDDPIWLVNYHAIFNLVGPRTVEVGHMANVYSYFHGRSHGGESSNRVVIAGDWNFPAHHRAFNPLRQAIGANVQIRPNEKSSLNSKGRVTSRYDHFVWEGNDLHTAEVVDPPIGVNKRTFRERYSDHLGIDAFVNY
jgi:hypothetical protein